MCIAVILSNIGEREPKLPAPLSTRRQKGSGVRALFCPLRQVPIDGRSPAHHPEPSLLRLFLSDTRRENGALGHGGRGEEIIGRRAYDFDATGTDSKDPTP